MSAPYTSRDLPPADITAAERNAAMVIHLTGLTSLLGGVVLAGIWVPLIIWLLKKDTSPFVARSGAEAINFQISFHLWAAISALLVFVLIGLLLLPLVSLLWLIFTIVGAVKASNGQEYRYPLTIRLIKA